MSHLVTCSNITVHRLEYVMKYLCRCPSEESIFKEPFRILNTRLTYKKDTPQHVFHIIRISY